MVSTIACASFSTDEWSRSVAVNVLETKPTGLPFYVRTVAVATSEASVSTMKSDLGSTVSITDRNRSSFNGLCDAILSDVRNARLLTRG